MADRNGHRLKVVGEGKSVSWGGARNKGKGRECKTTKNCSCTVICWSCVWRKTHHQWVLPWHNCFLRLENLLYEPMRKKDRELLTNQIVLYTRLTHVWHYQNILEQFWTNLKLWQIWLTDQSYLRIIRKWAIHFNLTVDSGANFEWLSLQNTRTRLKF